MPISNTEIGSSSSRWAFKGCQKGACKPCKHRRLMEDRPSHRLSLLHSQSLPPLQTRLLPFPSLHIVCGFSEIDFIFGFDIPAGFAPAHLLSPPPSFYWEKDLKLKIDTDSNLKRKPTLASHLLYSPEPMVNIANFNFCVISISLGNLPLQPRS